MKRMLYVTVLVIFTGLHLPACAGDSDEGLLLFPIGGGVEGGPEESPENITDGLEVDNAEEVEELTDTEEADAADPETSGTESAEAEDRRTEAAEEAAAGEDDADGETANTGAEANDDSDFETELADGSETSGDTLALEDTDDKENAGESESEGAACKTRSLELDPTGGRWFKDEQGLYTFWAREKLILRVRGNCEAGWYKLKIHAKNTRGPLPDFYKRFNLTVADEITGRQLGGLFVNAFDDKVKKGRMWVYLEAGNTDLDLGWTNDAYKKGEYDANLHITKVALSKKPKVRKRKAMRRNAQNYCYEQGRWFYDDQARTARTYWRNQTIGYCFYGLQPGRYEVQVRARNYGQAGLPPGYERFEVNVAADGVSSKANIPAHETKFKKGTTVLDLRGGNVTVNLTWLNDRYKEGVYDANIEIRSIRLKRIGDSSRTGLAAFLGNESGQTTLVISISVMIALLGLGLVYAYRRRMRKQNV